MWKNADLKDCTLTELFELAFVYGIVRSVEWSEDGLVLQMSQTYASPLFEPDEARVFLISCLNTVPEHERRRWLRDRGRDLSA